MVETLGRCVGWKEPSEKELKTAKVVRLAPPAPGEGLHSLKIMVTWMALAAWYLEHDPSKYQVRGHAIHFQ